jgi:hypothetical protein
MRRRCISYFHCALFVLSATRVKESEGLPDSIKRVIKLSRFERIPGSDLCLQWY